MYKQRKVHKEDFVRRESSCVRRKEIFAIHELRKRYTQYVYSYTVFSVAKMLWSIISYFLLNLFLFSFIALKVFSHPYVS